MTPETNSQERGLVPGTAGKALFVLTLMLAGRAMTLAVIARAGVGGLDDPPSAWLLPLLGDAVIGLLALPIAYLIVRARGLLAWTLVIVWNAVAIWDALSAFIIERTVPWPQFFMLKAFGDSMFFAAAAMHGVCIYLACRPKALKRLRAA